MTASLWLGWFIVAACTMGLIMGTIADGGLSLAVGAVPAAAILLAFAHAAAGRAQGWWSEDWAASRLALSTLATVGFIGGWVCVLALRLEGPWMMGAIPTLGSSAGALAATWRRPYTPGHEEH